MRGQGVQCFSFQEVDEKIGGTPFPGSILLSKSALIFNIIVDKQIKILSFNTRIIRGFTMNIPVMLRNPTCPPGHT